MDIFQWVFRYKLYNKYCICVSLKPGRSRVTPLVITRVASHLARSDTPSITCIVARLSRSDTQQCYDAPPTNGKAPRAPLASAAQGLHAKFQN